MTLDYSQPYPQKSLAPAPLPAAPLELRANLPEIEGDPQTQETFKTVVSIWRACEQEKPDDPYVIFQLALHVIFPDGDMRRQASAVALQDLATHWFREGAAQEDRSFRQGLAKAASDLRHVIATGRLAES